MSDFAPNISAIRRSVSTLRNAISSALEQIMKRRWSEFKLGTLSKNYPALPGERVWVNNLYHVFERPLDSGDPKVKLVHLSIKRNDREPIHDWRDLQRIKNEIVGPEAEGVELYPAESRLVDNANQYHMWCMSGEKFPFGFPGRMVTEGSVNGSKQRPFPKGERPADCMSPEEAERIIAQWKTQKRDM